MFKVSELPKLEPNIELWTRDVENLLNNREKEGWRFLQIITNKNQLFAIFIKGQEYKANRKGIKEGNEEGFAFLDELKKLDPRVITKSDLGKS